ncbi:MAG: MsnO8 family LLM class oxidoreductase, partial [Pseudomonadales bacterium]
MTAFSILDLVPITQGSNAATALVRTKNLAISAEQWGYNRYWVAEHHNMPGIASSATAVVIGHIAGATQTIRVGSGGIMLPNHAPLMVAEQFGTLATLFPNRIDLGLGRAPGTDGLTMQALRRNLNGNVEDFPRDVVELQHYLNPKYDAAIGKRTAIVAREFTDCTFLFAKVVGLSDVVSNSAYEPQLITTLLQDIFDRFDTLTDTYSVQRVRKTVNESYMVAAGLPDPDLLRSPKERAL